MRCPVRSTCISGSSLNGRKERKKMTDYIVASISLVCIFYTVTKIVGYSIDVFVAKFVATDAKLEKTVSSLISLTALR